MPNYTTSNEVKEVLQISADEETWDNEILSCVTTAEGFVDSILKAHGFSVPLSTVPQNVKDAAKYFAAYYFMERRAPQEELNKFYDRAQDFLSRYIKQVGDEIAFIVGTDES